MVVVSGVSNLSGKERVEFSSSLLSGLSLKPLPQPGEGRSVTL